MNLPIYHHITELVTGHFHEKSEHQGHGVTNIIGYSKAVSNVIHKCVICGSLRSLPQKQKMAELPVDIFKSSTPFTYCEVEFVGPQRRVQIIEEIWISGHMYRI